MAKTDETSRVLRAYAKAWLASDLEKVLASYHEDIELHYMGHSACFISFCHVATLFQGSGDLLGALQVGDDTTGDAHDVIRVCTEVVVPRSSRGPHLVVLQQVRINEHT